MTKLGLKEYENLLAMSTVSKDWEGVIIYDEQNNLLTEHKPWQPSDFTIGGEEDEAKIIDEIQRIKKVGPLIRSLGFIVHPRRTGGTQKNPSPQR